MGIRRDAAADRPPQRGQYDPFAIDVPDRAPASPQHGTDRVVHPLRVLVMLVSAGRHICRARVSSSTGCPRAGARAAGGWSGDGTVSTAGSSFV